MDKIILLHHLRNPYGIDEDEMRKARLHAAGELERLYKMEEEIQKTLDRMIAKKKAFGIK